MSKEYEKSDSMGYNLDSSPITKEVLVKRVKSASKRVKSGQFITQEEIEKEIENW